MVPRDPMLVTAYRSAKQQRPPLKVHGIWTYGVSPRVSILEENQRSGSAMICELIALAVEDAFKYSKIKPECLVIIGDNTVKGLKNTFCLSRWTMWTITVSSHLFLLYTYVFDCCVFFSNGSKLYSASSIFRMCQSQVYMRLHVSCVPHTRYDRRLSWQYWTVFHSYVSFFDLICCFELCVIRHQLCCFCQFGVPTIQDQLWGPLSRRLGWSSQIVDADSACDIIRDELSKSSLQKWINGKVIVHVLRKYRDWKTHCQAHAPISFESCATIIQYFSNSLGHLLSFGILFYLNFLVCPRKVAYWSTGKQIISLCFASGKAGQKRLRELLQSEFSFRTINQSV